MAHALGIVAVEATDIAEAEADTAPATAITIGELASTVDPPTTAVTSARTEEATVDMEAAHMEDMEDRAVAEVDMATAVVMATGVAT